MQNPLANFIGVFSLVRDVRGFQVNPLCRHDITSPFPPSGNGDYVRNLDDINMPLTVSHRPCFDIILMKFEANWVKVRC